MTDEWEPLPQRKRSRRVVRTTGPNLLPATCTDQNGHDAREALASGPAAPVPAEATAAPSPNNGEGVAAPAPSRHAAPDPANLEKVATAVMARAASQRAARGGGEMGMGNDGVGGDFYEYLDHTADVQLHAWGRDLTAALEHLVPCMSNYMTDLSTVEIDPARTQELEVEGHDLPSLLFAYLDEFLFRFSTEAFVVKRATIFDFQRPQPSSSEGQGRPEREDVEGGAGMAAAAGAYRIRVRAEGEGFDLAKHPQGTEIKAITFSNMQIHENEGQADVYVIVDI